MKKSLMFLLVLLLTALLPVSAAAAPKDKDNNSGGKNNPSVSTSVSNSPNVKESATDDDSALAESDQPVSESEEGETASKDKSENLQKVFKTELNTQKKELNQQKSQLAEEKETLEEEYQALLDSGDTAAAEALLAEIESLDSSIGELKNQIKNIINERYMVVKTMYSDEELTQFQNAAELIAQMYEDAKALDAGSLTINNQLIKFTAPIYIKGGNVMVPVKSLSEKFGAEVIFDETENLLTITRENTVIEISASGVTATVNGEVVDLNDQIEVTCGRTYINLKQLSDLFDLEAAYDAENELLDIDLPTDEPIEGTIEADLDVPESDPSGEPAVDEGDPIVPNFEQTTSASPIVSFFYSFIANFFNVEA